MIRSPVRLTARSLGAAASAVIERSNGGTERGHQLGSFGRGWYLSFGGTILAVGDPTVPFGPLHIVTGAPVPEVRDHAPVSITPNELVVGDVHVELGTAERWDPRPPGALGCRTAIELLAALPVAPTPTDVADVWEEVSAAAGRWDHDRARELLQGRGPGLTPVGDDILAGMLLLRSLARPGDLETAAIAERAATTDLSRSFLHWSARGHNIAPVHELIDAAAAGRTEELPERAAVVAGIGASSGAALLAGLSLAARGFP